jgi:hypothetical protein
VPAYPVVFRDFDFPHHFAWCRSKLEERSLRWIPYGMPRLNENLARAVFFLYGKAPDPNGGTSLVGPLASGVIITSAGAKSGDVLHLYAVTSAHTAPKGASVIRLNTTDGKSRTIDIEPDQWQFIPGGADISAIDITERIDPKRDDIGCIPAGWWGSKEFIKTVSLGLGEDGFMLGLLANHPGEHKNMIAARFGNVSMLASEEAPIKQPNGATHPSHLFDMRSRGGFSGSPVFVYRTPDGDLRSVDFGVRRRTSVAPKIAGYGSARRDDREPDGTIEWQFEHDTENNLFVSLLGIHAGQYPEPVKVKKIKAAPKQGEADAIQDGEMLEIPGGMTIVVPIWEVYDLLNLEVFVRQRKAREARILGQSENDAIAESGDGMEAVTVRETDNPSHKEDFMSLLNAAARSNKPAS